MLQKQICDWSTKWQVVYTTKTTLKPVQYEVTTMNKNISRLINIVLMRSLLQGKFVFSR